MIEPIATYADQALKFTTETRLVARAVTSVARISNFILQHLHTIKQCSNVAFGSKDIFKGVRVAVDQWHCARINPRVERAFWGVMGGATVVVGAGCVLLGSHLKGFTTDWDGTFFQVGDGFFIMACMIRLRNSLADYHLAKAINNIQGMHNAVLGVLGSLSALFATFLIIIPCPMTFWCFFCYLGAALSVIQFLHNLFHGKYNIYFLNKISFQVV